MKETVLLIDAGHGALHPTTGANMTDPKNGKLTLHTNGKHYHGGSWFYEGESNRNVAKEFINQSNQLFQCVPVYHPYIDTSLQSRVDIANLYFAKIQAPCLYLSFHSNAAGVGTAPQEKAFGVTLHTLLDTGAAFDISKSIAPMLNEAWGLYGSKRKPNWPLHFKADKHVTRYTAMPAIILEIGFFDNPLDADILMNKKAIEYFCFTLKNELSRVLK